MPLASPNHDRRAKRRFVVIFTPGRIEEIFRAVAAKKVDDVEAFASSYGTRITAPALHPGLHNYFTPRPRSQDSAQMGLAENDDMIQALAADRPDQPFGKPILPR
jgi:hypothetical protein